MRLQIVDGEHADQKAVQKQRRDQQDSRPAALQECGDAVHSSARAVKIERIEDRDVGLVGARIRQHQIERAAEHAGDEDGRGDATPVHPRKRAGRMAHEAALQARDRVRAGDLAVEHLAVLGEVPRRRSVRPRRRDGIPGSRSSAAFASVARSGQRERSEP